MLDLSGVSAGYGRATVLSGCDLRVAPGEVVALIGANGAGKSTLVGTLSGLLPARTGTITLDGERIERLPPRERVRRGLVQVPEGRQVFATLSVAENLTLGAYAGSGGAEARQTIEEACRFFPVLLDRLGEPAGNLSGGQQQMLAIARGLMARPRYLLLDEPSLGLAPLVVGEIFDLVGRLRQEGISILLSEQNARQSLAVSDCAYVLETGRIVLQGPAGEIAASSEVAEKYLGLGATEVRDPDRQALLEARLRRALAPGAPRPGS